MIPAELRYAHITKAIRDIDRGGIPPHRESYRYELLLHGKRYPPKLVISIATQYAKGSPLSPQRFNAVEAKNYFLREGFTILDRTSGSEKVRGRLLSEDEESSFPEGKEKYKKHRALERDATIVKKAKELRLQEQGELKCDVCDLVFADVYGSHGAGYIEAHHTVPVAELRGVKKTKISDLALVCANCHRVLHRAKPRMSVEQLRAVVHANREIVARMECNGIRGMVAAAPRSRIPLRCIRATISNHSLNRTPVKIRALPLP